MLNSLFYKLKKFILILCFMLGIFLTIKMFFYEPVGLELIYLVILNIISIAYIMVNE